MSGKGVVCSVLGLMILAAGGILHIVGFATPAWGVVRNRYADMSLGLWAVCYPGMSCFAIKESLTNYKAIYGFTITGIAFTLLAGLLALVNLGKLLCRKQPARCASLFSQVFGFLAMASIEVGVAIFGAMVGLEKDSLLGRDAMRYGYSFYLSAVGGVLVSLGALIGFLANHQTCKTETYSQQAPPLPEKTPPVFVYN